MIKNFFVAIFAATIIFTANVHSVFAETSITPILDTPGGTFSEPEKVYQTIQETLDKIFKISSTYKISPLSDGDAYVQIYREENDLAYPVTEGYIVSTMPGLDLKKKDIENIAEHFDTDFLVYMRVSNSAPRFSGGFMTSGQKVNVTLDFRVWSRKKNDFIYAKRSVTTGSSNSFYIQTLGSSSHAIEKGLKKGLAEIEKDAKTIRMAMIDSMSDSQD